MAVEAAEKASNDDSTERGGAGERGNADFTAFVSNLPFNVTADELREKFKHVSFSMCHCHPFRLLLLPLVCHLYTGYSVVILLISDWLRSTSEDELVSLAMWSFSLRWAVAMP